MSLDNEDPKLIALTVGAAKGRMDFIIAVQALHVAILGAIRTLDEDPELAGV